MAVDELKLDGVADGMRAALRDYCDLLHDLGGSNIRSLALFGSISTAAFDSTQHVARSVLIQEHVDLDFLQRLAPHGPGLGKQSIAAPLVMTPQYIEASLDTFPLEFIEIQQQHLTVVGEDYFSDLPLNEGHVRLQCERELKTVLIGMRQGLLASAGSDKFLEALERDVGEGFIRTLRGLIWLKGQRDAKSPDEIVAEVERIAGREMPGVRRARDPNAAHGWNEFELLYEDVQKLGAMVNDW